MNSEISGTIHDALMTVERVEDQCKELRELFSAYDDAIYKYEERIFELEEELEKREND